MTRPTEQPGRRLVLLRHAKAERPLGTPDADRNLTARGHADAAAAGAWLARNGYPPVVVICSPAKRTRQTWHDVALGMGAPPSRRLREPMSHAPGTDDPAARRVPVIRYERRMYHGGVADLLDLVRTIEPEAATVLLVGHNPAISALSELLDPVHADPNGLRTCGIAVHRTDGLWSELAAGAAALTAWQTARG